MEIPADVRELALCPMRVVPPAPGMEQIDIGGAIATVSPSQLAPLVHIDSSSFDVPAAVHAARAIARERGKERVIWYLTPGDDWVGAELERLGVPHRDAPGFEASADALALVDPPTGEVPADVEVAVVQTWQQYRDSFAVVVAAFDLPVPDEEAVRARWARYVENMAYWQGVCASIDGEIVGMGSAGFSPVGLSLQAGSVLPAARGRGVYRALVHARWQLAVDRGTPALVIQAGRMSRPICERMGFRYVGTVRVHVDDLD